jgi:hypothetical protein
LAAAMAAETLAVAGDAELWSGIRWSLARSEDGVKEFGGRRS